MPADAGPAAAANADKRKKQDKEHTTRPTDQQATEDSVIAAERAHLARSREFLHLMRENALELAKNPMAGDRVSLEYLKADLYRRAEALKDLPDAPLFFGRLDYSELARKDEDFAGADFHIGRRHVHDPEGTPVVLDWRAPVSRPFYRASQPEPMGLTLRRRFGFAGGALTAYEDERFKSNKEAAAAPVRSEANDFQPTSNLLINEIERPRSGPMRDIVATIQPEQDDIVRAGAATTVCVQGAPGTGKTAVGLHRVAYLLYAHKEQVTRRGVVVVGPNLAFLSYIRNVLPALGELDVTQTTVADLVATTPIRGTDTDETATVKGDARMAELLRDVLWSSVKPPAEALVLSRGTRRLRVPAYEIEELARELRERGVRYGTGRELLAHRIAHVILLQLEAAGRDLRRPHPRLGPPLRAGPQVRRRGLAEGGSEASGLHRPLRSKPAPIERTRPTLTGRTSLIRWQKVPRGLAAAPWTRADQVLIDEAADLIERTPSIAHVVVDEAQDLSPMEVRAIGRRCATGAATVLGDIAQGTTPWAATSWPELLKHLGKPDAAVRELDVGYRVPRQILDFASRLLPSIAPGLAPARSLRADPAALSVVQVAEGELGAWVAAGCATALERPGSVAVICADAQVPEVSTALAAAGLACSVLGAPESSAGEMPGDGRLAIVPVTLAKGLEFDHVVLVEPGRIATGEAYGLRRLYVALTRAVSRLTVFHAEALPAELLLRSIKRAGLFRPIPGFSQARCAVGGVAAS